MNTIEEYKVTSPADGLELQVTEIRPHGEIRGLLQIAHGMCDHKERYYQFMEFMSDHGIACVIHDHRGHGGSILDMDDLGYFYKAGAEGLVRDLHAITVMFRAKYPGKKLMLLGHSMGSLAVRNYIAEYDGDIDGLVVTGSPGENSAVGFGLGLITVLEKAFGERHRSRLIQGMTVGGYNRRFRHEGKKNAWLSVDPDNVEGYNTDPLCNYSFTLNGNRALLHLLQGAYGKKNITNPDIPVRLYSGADDPCAPNAKGFQNAVDHIRADGYHDVKGMMFPGLRHEILREKGCEKVYDTILREAAVAVFGQEILN